MRGVMDNIMLLSTWLKVREGYVRHTCGRRVAEMNGKAPLGNP